MEGVVCIKKGSLREFYGTDLPGTINFSSFSKLELRTTSNQYSLKYVSKGEESYRIDGVKHKLKAGQFLLIKPNQRVETSIASPETVTGACIYFEPRRFENSLSKQLLNPDKEVVPTFPIDTRDIPFEPYYAALLRDQNHLDTDLFLDWCIREYAALIGLKQVQLKALKTKKTDAKLALWKKLEQSKTYMHNNYHLDMNLKDIADSACLSPFHFQRCFKTFYGLSPTKYLHIIRMRKALTLLDNNWPIESVSVNCGFSSVKYFKSCLKSFKANQN